MRNYYSNKGYISLHYDWVIYFYLSEKYPIM